MRDNGAIINKKVRELKEITEHEILKSRSRADAWRAVTFRSKKNGEPYQRLMQNIQGAHDGYSYGGTKFLYVEYQVGDHLEMDAVQIAHNDGAVCSLEQIKWIIINRIDECEDRAAFLEKEVDGLEKYYVDKLTLVDHLLAEMERDKPWSSGGACKIVRDYLA